jgi:hypothetical protein
MRFSSIIFLTGILLIKSNGNASDLPGIFKSVDVTVEPSRTHSSIGILSDEEVRNLNKIYKELSPEHKEAVRANVFQQNQVLLEVYTKSINRRHRWIACWSNCHSACSGALKITGVVVTVAGGILTTVAQFIGTNCGSSNWLGVSGIGLTASGAGIYYLGLRSQDAGKRTDDLILSELGRTEHQLSVLDGDLSQRDVENLNRQHVRSPHGSAQNTDIEVDFNSSRTNLTEVMVDNHGNDNQKVMVEIELK